MLAAKKTLMPSTALKVKSQQSMNLGTQEYSSQGTKKWSSFSLFPSLAGCMSSGGSAGMCAEGAFGGWSMAEAHGRESWRWAEAVLEPALLQVRDGCGGGGM